MAIAGSGLCYVLKNTHEVVLNNKGPMVVNL